MEYLNVAFAAAGLIVLLLARSVYRLYFHPLSGFPGPKIAAVSHLYEFYHDVLRDGMFIWEIERMHKKYGPIVRINPRELHIKDSLFYDEIYASGSRKRDKDPKFVPIFSSPYSMIATVDHELHRFRRGLLSNFFSQASVSKLGPLIEKKVSQLMRRFEEAYADSCPLDLSASFSALTSDIITIYSYGEDFNFLGEKGFKNNVRDAIMETASVVHINRFFPFFVPLMRRIPPWIMAIFKPATAVVFRIQQRIAEQSAAALRKTEAKVSPDSKARRTMFDALSSATIPAKERTLSRLQDEGMILLSGGAEPTANALTVASFHLLNDKSILTKLRSELSAHGDCASLPQLMKLPYLNGVVNEALRLSYGIVIRPPRICHTEVLKYGEVVIPPGTPVSMSSYFVHMDRIIFPEPESFNPDRWIEATAQGKNLTKFIVSFGRGSRACVGMNLAYAELYLTISQFARKFDMELYDTTYENIRVARERGLPYAKTGHWNVKATVTQIVSAA
ncbi:hypothetical protein NLG97_g4228 [Lecanicillium saksenae]|uniref:Uncharacterized protein n=1 Tax=Lecanicillium saksenae TaxID=468837 RepID=A0ACC1QZS9_9HYPO|nr:hypothetical protein NLG97_g4228 [Lecanicillium saksenae]